MSDQVLSQAEIDAMIAEAPPPAPAAAAPAAPPPPARQPIIAAAPEAEPPGTPLPPRATNVPAPEPEVWAPPLSSADGAPGERAARPSMRVAHAPIREPATAELPAPAPPSSSNSAVRDALDRIGQMEIEVDQLRRSRAKVRQLDGELQSLRARVDELELRLAGPRRARAGARGSLWSAGFYVDRAAGGSGLRTGS